MRANVRRDESAAPVWEPLEAALPLAQCDGFMFMATFDGCDETGAPVAIHLYKHGITRYYLNLSDDGRAWEYGCDMSRDARSALYDEIDLAGAIEHAFGGIETLLAPQDRDRGLRAAGYLVISGTSPEDIAAALELKERADKLTEGG